MKKARLNVVGLYCPSNIIRDSALCQLMTSPSRLSAVVRLCLSRRLRSSGSGVPSEESSAWSMSAARSPSLGTG
jgi:hypothetical protein